MSSRSARIGSRALLSLIVGVCALSAVTFIRATSAAAPANAKPDAAASREAFLQVYKVFTSPRCQNCHPSGDAPLQGDDSHVHLQNVKRGNDGRGVYGMRCNPKWGLPPAAHKMVFVGRSPAELCRQLQDPKQTGGRSLQALLEHVASDDLVGWAWDPGQRRSLPPLSRADTVAQIKIWIEGGATCPE